MDEQTNSPLMEAWLELAERVPLTGLSAEDKDMLWCVTRVRAGAYLLFSQMGLLAAAETAPAIWEQIVPTFQAVMANYFIVAAQHPVRIEYAPDKVETPRIDILNAALAVYDQLQTDEKVRDSACELVRIVATNPDSNHEKIGYATLVGIVAKIVSWIYPDHNIQDAIAGLFQSPEQPASTPESN